MRISENLWVLKYTISVFARHNDLDNSEQCRGWPHGGLHHSQRLRIQSGKGVEGQDGRSQISSVDGACRGE